MTLISRLPFPPVADESARGLIVRLAEDNLCSSAQMCEWLEIPRIDVELVDPVRAAGIMGIASDALAAMGFADAGIEPILGHGVPRQSAVRHIMRVCPACLSEAPYHRRIWDHVQIDACPIHRLKLLDRCPACQVGGRIRWGRNVLLVGECGHDLSGQLAEPAGDCVGAAAVYRRCGLACDGPDLPAPFADLPLQDLIDVLFFLGRTDLVIAQGNPDGFAPRTMWAEGAILDAGTRIAVGWPGTFDDLARRVRGSYPGAKGVMLQYGYLHRFVMSCGDAPYAGLLRSAYAAHLESRGDVPPKAWPGFLPVPASGPSAVSTLEARKLLGLGWESFTILKRQPLWTDLKPLLSGRNGTPQFARGDVMTLGTVLARLVSPYVADGLLGISQGKVSQMVAAGLLPVHMWNRNHRNGEQRSVDTADVMALFGKIGRLCLPAPPGQPISFQTMLRMAVMRRVIDFPDVVRCLLAGTLRGHLPVGTKGFGGMVFEEADATEILGRMASPARSGKMCLRDVSRKLKIPGKAVHQLVAAKLLAKPERKSAYLFDADAVELFWDEFTYDTALARGKHVRPAGIRDALKLLGVRPVATINMQKAVTAAVYRKADLAGL